MVTQDTLPLVEAYGKFKRSEISWEEYIHNLFRLVAGDPHEDDTWDKPHWNLRKADLLADSIVDWHRHRDFIKGGCDVSHALVAHSNARSTDTLPMEAIFIVYRNGSCDDVGKTLARLEVEQQKGMRAALAILALRERRADILKMCLDHGFTYGEAFEDAANRVKPDNNPKTYKVIQESDFRRQYPRHRPRPRVPY